MFERISPVAYRRITLAALVSLAAIIVTGAAVRLTDSGLGCSDWPTCEDDQLVAAADDVHAMIEFVNRAFTGVVSIAVILAVLGSLRRRPYRADLVRWSWGLVAGVVAQIVIGAVVVRTELTPISVTAHFLVSMVLVWNAVVLHHKAGEPDDEPTTDLTWRGREAIERMSWAIACAAVVVLVTGTIVTGSGPHGGDPDAERLPFDIPGVTRIHGITVIGLGLLVLATIIKLRDTEAPVSVQRQGTALLVVLLAQAGIGYVQYFTGVPALLVGAHVLGATILWIAVVAFALAVGPNRVAVEPKGTDQAPTMAEA